MRIVFAGHKERGVACLSALVERHTVRLVLAHPGSDGPGTLADAARAMDLPVEQPQDINAPDLVGNLRSTEADVMVLAGYSPIVKRPLLRAFPLGILNLHGGSLPRYRGSSPMNWALMNGDAEITVCVIRAVERVDAGDVLAERTFAVGPDETIADVQNKANEIFPELLVRTLADFASGPVIGRPQNDAEAVYWPRRFPEDGLIAFDLLTAKKVHDRVRALTTPYPGAFTRYAGERLTVLRSEMASFDHRGEPGRVYRSDADGLLVCASDRCLWLRDLHAEDGTTVLGRIPRYAMLGTVRGHLT